MVLVFVSVRGHAGVVRARRKDTAAAVEVLVEVDGVLGVGTGGRVPVARLINVAHNISTVQSQLAGRLAALHCWIRCQETITDLREQVFTCGKTGGRGSGKAVESGKAELRGVLKSSE